MSAVAQHTDGVDTLAAWLTAYLAAPASAPKGSFTVPELLAVAGLPRNGPNASAMGRALRHSGLVVSKRKQGDIRQWAWFRPHLVAKHPAPATAKRRMVMHQTTGNAAFLPGHTEGDRRFTVFDPGAPEGDATAVAIGRHTVEGWRFDLGGLLRSLSRASADSVKAFISATEAFRASFPSVPAPDLDDMAERAREAVQRTVQAAGTRHQAMHREQSIDIRDRMHRALQRHRRDVAFAMDDLALSATANAGGWGCNDYPKGEHLLHRAWHRGCDDVTLLLDPTNDRRARPRGARP